MWRDGKKADLEKLDLTNYILYYIAQLIVYNINYIYSHTHTLMYLRL